MAPLLTHREAAQLETARVAGATELELSLDLERNRQRIELRSPHWRWQQHDWPYPGRLKERTVYAPEGDGWAPLARFDGALIKLVPTDWGPPTFEIDGIKMLVSAQRSPLDDARAKVALVRPRGARVLDCCGGLGYFTLCLLEAGAATIRSFEKNSTVLWLRSLNPWSPSPDARLLLTPGDVANEIAGLADRSFDAVLHDPPRFGIAGELYSREFYEHLARVLVPGGRLFHYTGAPNRITSGRDVPGEVLKRLTAGGFDAQRTADGVLAVRGRT